MNPLRTQPVIALLLICGLGPASSAEPSGLKDVYHKSFGNGAAISSPRIPQGEIDLLNRNFSWGRYKGRIKSWDVVNEAIDDHDEHNGMRESPWFVATGEDYIAEAFRAARKADPAAVLYYNDFNIEQPDRSKGAAITWLSWADYPQNSVNHADPGRLIQQSYYAGHRLDRSADGQSSSWNPWTWNPIQGGGVASWARVNAMERRDDGTLFGETVPKLWDMPNEEAAALMRQWTGFEPSMPDVVVVKLPMPNHACELRNNA